MKTFHLDIKKEGEITVIKVIGDLDSRSVPVFDEKMRNVIQESKKIVMDFADLSYICSAALGNIFANYKKCRQSGGNMVVIGVNSRIANPFNAVGFHDLMEFADNLTEAKKMLK